MTLEQLPTIERGISVFNKSLIQALRAVYVMGALASNAHAQQPTVAKLPPGITKIEDLHQKQAKELTIEIASVSMYGKDTEGKIIEKTRRTLERRRGGRSSVHLFTEDPTQQFQAQLNQFIADCRANNCASIIFDHHHTHSSKSNSGFLRYDKPLNPTITKMARDMGLNPADFNPRGLICIPPSTNDLEIIRTAVLAIRNEVGDAFLPEPIDIEYFFHVHDGVGTWKYGFRQPTTFNHEDFSRDILHAVLRWTYFVNQSFTIPTEKIKETEEYKNLLQTYEKYGFSVSLTVGPSSAYLENRAKKE